MSSGINNIVERRYIKDMRAAKATLKYLIHRNDAGQKMTRTMYLERVADCGLGTDYHAILDALVANRSPYALMWMHVISPDPLVQSLLPEGEQKAAILELAERYIDGLYAGLGFRISLMYHHRA